MTKSLYTLAYLFFVLSCFLLIWSHDWSE